MISSDSDFRSILLFVSALVVAIALACGMAYVFFRKRHRRRREHYSYPSFSSQSSDSSHSGRRRRRGERPRNPTRAETGGLPTRNDLESDPLA